MTRATAAEQRTLLELQRLDTGLARLAHERSALSVLQVLRDLAEHHRSLDAERVALTTQLADERRDLRRVEGDVEQAQARVQRHEQRLGAGVPAKEAQALQEELDHLAGRISALEDEQLAVMDVVEGTEAKLAGVQTALDELAGRVATAEGERDAEFARIDDQAAHLEAQREEVVATLPADVVKVYERVREEMGGLAVIALRGQRSEPVALNFSLTELADIQGAPEDELVISEEHGYIVVRVNE